jgi:hypothetical protein
MLVIYCVMIAAIVLRVMLGISEMPFANVMPLMAIAFTSSACLDRRHDWLVPVLMLLGSDAVLNVHYGFGPIGSWTIVSLVCIVPFALAGRWVTGHRSVFLMVSGSLACTMIFYLVSNTASFLTSPDYPAGFAGWVQALTVGLPGYPPTWTFLRNSLIGDLSYTVLLVAVLNWLKSRMGQPLVPVWPVRSLGAT